MHQRFAPVGLFFPLSLIQGETLKIPLDIEVDGTRIIFADYTFTGAVRAVGVPVNVLTFTFTEQDSMPLADIGSTAAIAAADYVYEIRMTHTATSKVTTLLYGTVEIYGARV
jgi:hypothetical protein